MLTWIAHTFPFLRRVPVLPQLLDMALMAHTLVRHPAAARAMHALEREVLGWPGVSAQSHRFGGTEFRAKGREIGHLHGHGLLDVLLTRAIRDDAVQARVAQPHHIFPHSAWVSLQLRTAADVPAALALLHRSYDRCHLGD